MCVVKYSVKYCCAGKHHVESTRVCIGQLRCSRVVKDKKQTGQCAQGVYLCTRTGDYLEACDDCERRIALETNPWKRYDDDKERKGYDPWGGESRRPWCFPEFWRVSFKF